MAADDGLAALAETLASPSPSLRMRALEVLCEFSAERATPVVIELIHDPDPAVRSAAARAAARIRSTRAVGSLIVALDDPDAGMRRSSAEALQSIVGGEVEVDDEPDAEQRRRRQAELKRWWKERRFAELATSTQGSGHEPTT